MDEDRIKPRHWLGSVLRVGFSATTLLAGTASRLQQPVTFISEDFSQQVEKENYYYYYYYCCCFMAIIQYNLC